MIAAAVCIAVGSVAMEIGASFAVAMAVGEVMGAAVVGAGIGAGLNAATQLAVNGKIDWDKVGQGTWMGAATGGGLSALGQAGQAAGLVKTAEEAQAAQAATTAARAEDATAGMVQSTNAAGETAIDAAKRLSTDWSGADLKNALEFEGFDSRYADMLSKPDVINALNNSGVTSQEFQSALAKNYSPTLAQSAWDKVDLSKVAMTQGANAIKNLVNPPTAPKAAQTQGMQQFNYNVNPALRMAQTNAITAKPRQLSNQLIENRINPVILGR